MVEINLHALNCDVVSMDVEEIEDMVGSEKFAYLQKNPVISLDDYIILNFDEWLPLINNLYAGNTTEEVRNVLKIFVEHLIFTECEINYNNLIESLNSYISTLSTEDEVDTYLSRNTLEDMLNIERVIKELKCSITNKINFNTKTNYIPYSWIENSTDLIVVLVRKNNDRKH